MDTTTKAFHALIKQANMAHFTYNRSGPQAAGYQLARLAEMAVQIKGYMDKIVEVGADV